MGTREGTLYLIKSMGTREGLATLVQYAKKGKP
jgi:hypothetical protein